MYYHVQNAHSAKLLHQNNTIDYTIKQGKTHNKQKGPALAEIIFIERHFHLIGLIFCVDFHNTML